jgi:conjugal transfer/entry exclusion protein
MNNMSRQKNSSYAKKILCDQIWNQNHSGIKSETKSLWDQIWNQNPVWSNLKPKPCVIKSETKTLCDQNILFI